MLNKGEIDYLIKGQHETIRESRRVIQYSKENLESDAYPYYTEDVHEKQRIKHEKIIAKCEKIIYKLREMRCR